jgi:hypothetical protein
MELPTTAPPMTNPTIDPQRDALSHIPQNANAGVAEDGMVEQPNANACAASVRRDSKAGSCRALRIFTNLPERLPILPQELALIQGYMGDLVSGILANDNEPL